MNAKEKIREHLDGLFEDVPKSRASWELQEELLANSMERYEDLVKGGMDEEAALNQVMGSIGNVDELIAALPSEDHEMYRAIDMEMRQKSAMITAIAVGLYILAGAVFFVGVLVEDYFAFASASMIGLIVAIIICIFPTCMLVYNANRMPKYNKKDATVVEEFKAWNNDSQKSKKVRGAVSSLLWTLTTVVYLAVSFFTGKWWITWIIFLISSCIEAAINLIFRLQELK